jgi:cation-transporting ATPase 13A2
MDFSSNTFRPIEFDVTMTQDKLLKKYGSGNSEREAANLLEKFGPCQLEVPRKSVPSLLVDEVLNPFYLFQVFSMILWFWDGY